MLNSGLYGLKLKTGQHVTKQISVNKSTNHVQNSFQFFINFNFKKCPVAASGCVGGVGGASGRGERFFTNFIEENETQNIQQLSWFIRITF